MQYDTIVVGLGSAGVTAASTLAKAGRRVLGLEAQNRIGGRVNTVPFGDGVVELGAEWIHGTRGSRVYDTAMRNNITILSQNLTIDVFQSDGTRGDVELVNELVEYSLAAVEEAGNETVPLGVYLTRKIKEHIRETRPELLEDQDFLETFLDLMDLIVDNYEGSDSWNDVSSQTNYEELEGDQHLSWHRHGYKTFFELLLNTYQGGPGYPNLDVKLNAEVSKIVWPQQPSQLVEVTCADGNTYRANNVIVTVSVGVLKDRHNSLFEPPLPEAKSLAIARTSMGVVDKVVLSFPYRWWSDCDNFWLKHSTQERARALNETGWVTHFASSGMGSRNNIVLWYIGETARLPPLPEAKSFAISHINMGVVDKVVLAFSHRWWPNHDSYWFKHTTQERIQASNETGWVSYFASCGMGSRNTISLWYTGRTARLVETIPEDVVKRKSVELLQKFLGANITVPEPTGILRTTWFTNPYTRGSYTFDSVESMKYPNSREELGKPLLDSAGTPRVLFAGEATNLRHFSTVHGASETGYREAMRLLPSSKI